MRHFVKEPAPLHEEDPVEFPTTAIGLRRKLSKLEAHASGDFRHPDFQTLVNHRRAVRLLENNVSLTDVRKCNESDLQELEDVHMHIESIETILQTGSKAMRTIVRKQLERLLNQMK